MPVVSYKMGPGTLTLGEVGALMDISCQITSAVLSPEKDKEDDQPTLCGGTLAGEISYAWQLNATIVQDLSTNGINQWSLTNAGLQVPFKFVPNTALDKGYSGILTVDPLSIGGDVKTRPTSEVEWSLVGPPVPFDPTP